MSHLVDGRSGLKFLLKRISVSPISQLKRVIDVSIICNII